MVALNVIRRVEVRGSSTGLKEVAADLSAIERAQIKVASSADGMAVATDRSAKRALSVAGSYDRLLKSVDDVYRAEQRLASGQSVVERAFQQGVIDANEQARALGLLQVRYNSAAGANDNLGKAVSGSMGLARHEMINLSRQAQDVAVSLAGGQSPLTVLFQQGSQIGDVFATSQGTVGGFFKQVSSGLSSFLTAGRVAFGGVALAITGAGMALSSYLDSQQKVQMSLLGAGRASGATLGSINAIAQSGSSMTGLSVAEARAFAAELASTGKIGRDNLEPIVKIGHDIATVFGINAADAAKMLGKAFADPAKGAEQLNERLGFLDAAMQRQISNLVAQNRLQEAQKVLQSGVVSSLSDVNNAVATSTKLWTALGNIASNVWDKIGEAAARATGIGLRIGLDEQIETARKRIAELEQIASARSPAVNKALGTDRRLSDERQKYDELTAAIARNAAASEAAQERQRSFAQEAVARSIVPDVGQLEAFKNQAINMEKAIEDTQKAIKSIVPDEYASTRLKELTDALNLFSRALDVTKANARDFKTEFQSSMDSLKLANDAITAFSPGAKADIARRQSLNSTERSGLGGDERKALAEQAYANALKSSNIAISEQARARELSANQAVASADLEAKMVGQSIGKQSEMRANLQARQTLEQQLLQQHAQWGPQQDAELRRHEEINKKLGERVQIAAKAQVNDQIKFDRQTAFLSPEDLQIAQQLRSIYGTDVPAALSSSEAAAMRFNNQLKSINDIARQAAGQFANDLVSGLRSGEKAMDAIGHAAQNLSGMLTNSAITELLKGNLVGAAASGIGAIISGVIGNAQKKKDEAAAEAKKVAERMEGYAQRALLARIDTSTQEGELRAFDIAAQKQRLDEARAGGRAMASLEAALAQERLAITDKWAKQALEIEAAKAKAEQEAYEASLKRVQGYRDRVFAAANDNTNLDGALAEFNRAAMREQADEIAAGGQAINDLIAAQEAERLGIYRKFNDAAIAAAKQTADELVKYVQGVQRKITDYLQGLKTGSNSTLSPQAQLQAANDNFNAKFVSAQSGNRDALDSITQAADTLLALSKSYFASSAGYTTDFDRVTTALQGLSGISTSTVSDADKIAAAVQAGAVSTVTAVQGATSAVNITGAQADALAAAQNALAAQQVTYLQTQTNLLDAIRGLNATAADQLVQLKNLNSAQTTVTAGGVGQTLVANNTIISALNKIAVNTAFQFKSGGDALYQVGSYQDGGVIPGYANGGMVGNGIWGRDSVLARYAGGGAIALAGGEGVLTAQATARIGGAPAVDFINRNLGISANGPSNDNGPHFDRLIRAIVATTSGQINTLREELGALRATVERGTVAVRDNKPKAARPNAA